MTTSDERRDLFVESHESPRGGKASGREQKCDATMSKSVNSSVLFVVVSVQLLLAIPALLRDDRRRRGSISMFFAVSTNPSQISEFPTAASTGERTGKSCGSQDGGARRDCPGGDSCTQKSTGAGGKCTRGSRTSRARSRRTTSDFESSPPSLFAKIGKKSRPHFSSPTRARNGQSSRGRVCGHRTDLLLVFRAKTDSFTLASARKKRKSRQLSPSVVPTALLASATLLRPRRIRRGG